MEIFCIHEFKEEYDKLNSKKAYRGIEKELIEYFFGKTISELNNGICLNNSITTPYIKKRLKGSGGYRYYYLYYCKKIKCILCLCILKLDH